MGIETKLHVTCDLCGCSQHLSNQAAVDLAFVKLPVYGYSGAPSDIDYKFICESCSTHIFKAVETRLKKK